MAGEARVQPGPAFSPVRRDRIYEQVARQIRQQILEGRLVPGDRLPPERELARQFGVSRVSIRQALTLLMAEGLIENRVGEGTFLRENGNRFTITSLAASLIPGRKWEYEMQVRELIEPGAARLAATSIDRNLTELQRILERQQRALSDAEVFSEEDTAFHTAIAKLTRNPLLVRIIEILHVMTEPTRVQSLASEEGRRRSLAGHLRIFDAIRDGDAPGAEQAMLDHLKTVKTLLAAGGGAPPPTQPNENLA